VIAMLRLALRTQPRSKEKSHGSRRGFEISSQ